MLKQKGLSLPFQRTIGMVLGVLGLFIGVQAMMGVHAESLEPGQNELQAALNTLGGTTVTIGGDIPDTRDTEVTEETDIKPEKQFRGLVAFNMLSAANCNAVTAVSNHVQNLEVEIEKTAFFEGFQYAVNQTEFSGTCAGANSIDLPAENIKQNLYLLSPDASEPSNDIEGRYGRINFQIGQRFTIGEFNGCPTEELAPVTTENYPQSGERCGSILMKTDTPEILGEGTEPPDFFKGQRWAVFVPGGGLNEGIENSGDSWSNIRKHELFHDEHEHSEVSINSFWPGESSSDYTTGWMEEDKNLLKKAGPLYYYRIRMKNVPTISTTWPQYLAIRTENEDGGDGDDKYEDFVEGVKYKFCEGSEGYIQSNARKISNGGEASGTVSKKENAVFPAVYLTEGRTEDCIPTGKGKWDNDYFLGYEAEGKTCTNQEAVEGETKQVENTIGPQTTETIEAQCGYKETKVSFPKFEGEHTVYRPGLFTNSSQCENSQIKQSLDIESIDSENDGGIESINVGKWDWDRAKIEFTLTNEGDNPGRVNINFGSNDDETDNKEIDFKGPDGLKWRATSDGDYKSIDRDETPTTDTFTLEVDGRHGSPVENKDGHEVDVDLTYEDEGTSSSSWTVSNNGEGIQNLEFAVKNSDNQETTLKFGNSNLVMQCE